LPLAIEEAIISSYLGSKKPGQVTGTAGDQGEENWAELLREWLPRTYEVVTKGRIISQDGVTSPQIDVLVLKGSYPKKLLNKKLYLAAGVAAAFECKITLKTTHIVEALENCVKIKNLYRRRTGSPYRELHSPIIYGLLAHSHSWKGENSTPDRNIEQKLNEVDMQLVSHPCQHLDILCVADLAAWTSFYSTFTGPSQVPEHDWSAMVLRNGYHQNGSSSSGYMGHISAVQQKAESFAPIGVLISHLSQKLAWEEPSLRDLADYYRKTNISGSARGSLRRWPSSIFSEEIRPRVEAGYLVSGESWDEWHVFFT